MERCPVGGNNDFEKSSTFTHFEGLLPDEAELIEDILTLPNNRYVQSARIEFDIDTQVLWIEVVGRNDLTESPIGIVNRLVNSILRMREPTVDLDTAA